MNGARTFVGALLTLIGVAAAEAAETLSIAVGKVAIVRIAAPAATVTIGDPTVADLTVESPRLFLVTGKISGETNLLVLDGKGNEIVAYNVIVTPEIERHVTIHQGSAGTVTLNCDPRCARVKTPELVGKAASPAAGAPKAAAPKNGAAPKGAPPPGAAAPK